MIPFSLLSTNKKLSIVGLMVGMFLVTPAGPILVVDERSSYSPTGKIDGDGVAGYWFS